MRIFYSSSQTSTIYEEFPNFNTGADEILSIGKSDNGQYRVRGLVQFDITPISSSIANGTMPISTSFDLQLYVTTAESLNNNQTIQLYQISSSWTQGTGFFSQDILNNANGVTWMDKSSGSAWVVSGSDTISGSTDVKIGNPVIDMTIDISPVVRSWISGTIPNNGLLIQFDTGSEQDDTNWGSISYFSMNTHTIYSPKLVAKWNDQTISTGSLPPWPTQDLLVVPITLKDYHVGEVPRVNIIARQRYPLKTFATQFGNYSGSSYLPTSSYFSIIDDLSGTTIIPFDDNSRLSCDVNGNYFTFNVQNMYPQRYYRVMFKVDHDGVSDRFDEGFVFRVK